MNLKKRTLKNVSLKSRLLLAAAFWLGAMILAAGVGIPKLVNDYLVDDVKQQLSLTMDELTANIETNDSGNLIMAERLSDPRFNQPYSGIYWRA
ncbi:ATP-binding protein, partial [Vibrio splendidus]